MNRKIIETLLSKEYKTIYIILFLIIVFRIFILEPFRIPSGSMKPTILIGDFIFVNKFIYGINIPMFQLNIKINDPERGDIIIFKGKHNKNYIKRIIAKNNDDIKYFNKKIYLNGKIIKTKIQYKKFKFDKNYLLIEKQLKKEYLNPKKEYYIQIYKNINNQNYKFFNTKVPDNSYYVLGDNRDNSEDSRFWGFVEKKYIKGKAIIIWMSINYKILDIRWNRIFKIIK